MSEPDSADPHLEPASQDADAEPLIVDSDSLPEMVDATADPIDYGDSPPSEDAIPPDTEPDEVVDQPDIGTETALLSHDARSQTSWRALAVVCGFFALLMAGALGAAMWFYQSRILPRLDHAAAVPAPAATPVIDIAPVEAALAAANSRLAELQKQLEAEREAHFQTGARVNEISERLDQFVLKQNSLLQQEPGVQRAGTDTRDMPVMTPGVTPSVGELLLLKERNRLTSYADEAIATGERDSLQAIVDAMLDPSLKQLHFAAQAEFKRVQAYYNFSISIDPGYTLPVARMFGGPLIRGEEDLAPAQLTKILLDHQQPWEARLRSAFLLRNSTDKETDRVLLRALKEDPSLDVAKQAQTTFEKRVGRKFRLFDIPAIEAWWQMQGNLLPAPPREEP